MMLIHTVAAGGGSILHFDGARFRVGPDSAGANPGPKCYRRGGPLAVTDANVMVGKLIPDFFPKIFGPQQNLPLDADAVRAAFAALAKEIGDGRSAEQVADGFIKIAVENMANAIKKISVQRGYDVTRYALNCFGGAGGQHACLVADALGMTSVLIHPLSSLLSAYGMGLADIRSVRQQAIEEPFGDKARATLRRRGAAAGARRDRGSRRPGRRGRQDHAARARPYPLRRHRHAADRRCRHFAPAAARKVKLASLGKMKAAFERAHKAQFGFIDRSKVAGGRGGVGRGGRRRRDVQGEGRARPSARSCPRRRGARASSPAANGTARWSIRATRLSPGHKVKGPAIIIEPHQTVVVEHGWQAELTAKNHLVLRRVQKLARDARHRHPCRSGDARSVQQSVHVDRRADGRGAAEHRLFGEHQGAARFLLRGVRRQRLAGRQRAAHAGASRLDGPRGRDHHPREQGQDPPRRRLRHQRAL